MSAITTSMLLPERIKVADKFFFAYAEHDGELREESLMKHFEPADDDPSHSQQANHVIGMINWALAGLPDAVLVTVIHRQTPNRNLTFDDRLLRSTAVQTVFNIHTDRSAPVLDLQLSLHEKLEGYVLSALRESGYDMVKQGDSTWNWVVPII